MAALRVRLRTPGGIKTLSLPPDAPLAALRDAAAAAAALAPDTLVLRAGFPPKPLDLAAPGAAADALSPGEVVTASGPPAAAPAPTPAPASAPSPAPTPAPATEPPAGGMRGDSIAQAGRMREREVPDDNSCLFRAVSGVVYGEPGRDPNVLRRICAKAVAADPVFYTTDMLQRPNAAYCQWIMRPNSWGGPIELAILADHFKIELGAWDLKSMHASNYGEGRFESAGFLIFDGAHYNYVALNIGPGIPDVTQFPASDNYAREKVRQVAKARHDRVNYTDIDNNSLRCGTCGTTVSGAKGAQQHCDATGHGNFEELKS